MKFCFENVVEKKKKEAIICNWFDIFVGKPFPCKFLQRKGEDRFLFPSIILFTVISFFFLIYFKKLNIFQRLKQHYSIPRCYTGDL